MKIITTTSIIFKVSWLEDALYAVTLKPGLIPDGSMSGYSPIMPKNTDPAIMIADENHALKRFFLLINKIEANRAATVRIISRKRAGFAKKLSYSFV